MSDDENKNRHYEISNPSNATIGKTIESNNEKEINKNDNEENLHSENISKPKNEEKKINKSKEKKILKDELTQNDDNLFNNSMRDEEFNNNRINNYNSEDFNLISTNDIKDGNTTNQNDINGNNIQKMLNLSNTDIMNLVKSQSYLTNLPISKRKVNNEKNKDNRDIKKLKLKKETRIAYNSLREKENSICMEINAIKQKKQNLESFSNDIISSKNKVENNIINSKLKNLKNSENNLLDKLESVKQQIVNLLDKNKKLNRRAKLKTFLDKYNFPEASTDYSAKAKALDSEISKSRQNHLKDIERSLIKKENELNRQMEEQKKMKDDFMREFRRKEQEIIHKRKLQADLKMIEAKKFIKNTYNYDPNNYLYNRLANKFEESEKKFLESQISEKKKESGIEEISIVKRRIIECKYELEKRRIEKTNEMKQLWHSRSVSMAKYPSNILKQLHEFDLKKFEEEEKQKIQRLVLAKEKERFVKENVSLPPISEKLKNEREKRLNSFLNLEGRKRVQCIKDEFDKKIKNKFCLVEETILKKLEAKKGSRDKTLKSKDFETNSKLVKSSSDVNIFKYNTAKNKNKLNSLSPTTKLQKKKPNEINYLEQLRKERKINSKNYINWNKEINNSKSVKGENLDNVKKQIDVLDEKYEMNKNLIKIKGGYLNNQELGDDMNNLIINSIRGKLALMEKMDSL